MSERILDLLGNQLSFLNDHELGLDHTSKIIREVWSGRNKRNIEDWTIGFKAIFVCPDKLNCYCNITPV